MLHTSGHVVIVSAACLAVVFLILLIIPVDLIRSMGIAVCFTVITVALVSVANTTAMIALFPRFFLGEEFNFWRHDILNRRRVPLRCFYDEEDGDDGENTNMLPNESENAQVPSQTSDMHDHLEQNCCQRYCMVHRSYSHERTPAQRCMYGF